MKKLLMVANSAICPVINGSRKRMFSLVRLFEKAGCDVQIVITNDKVGFMDTVEQMPGNKIHFFDSDRKKSAGATQRAELRQKMSIDMLNIYSVPYRIDDMFPNGLDDFVAELHGRERFDFVIVEYVYMSKALTKLGSDVVKIVDTIDIHTGREKMYYSMGTKPLGFYTTRLQERKGVLRADYVFAIQKDESKYFYKLTGGKRKVLTIGNYLDVPNDAVNYNKIVLFVGSNNDPNREALNYFLQHIWGKVHNRVPDAQFWIAGDVSNSVKESPDYTKVGFVDDLSNIYKEVRVVVNPMLSGTGLPIKTIEALAYGKPIVATESGARGLYKEGKNPRAFLLAKNTEEFVNKLICALNDDGVINRIHQNCVRFVERYNDKLLRRLISVVEGSD